MGLLNAIKRWSFETNDEAHLFFSLCELLLISILFVSFYFTAIHLFFFFHYVIVIKYFANVCCLLERVFYFFNLTITARFS